ncbi:MAG: hypothetical protein GXO66_04280 [Euryarchaeota archaeon]|nr:hypothetical protein [Euryarchaeota archaeon]
MPPHYRKGFWMKPGREYQCASCGVKFGTSYPRFIHACPSCGADFLSYVEDVEEEEREVVCLHRMEVVTKVTCHFCPLRKHELCDGS